MKRMLFALLAGLALAGCDYFISPQDRVERAQAAIDAGDYRVALVELKNALQKDPQLATARLLLAQTALWLGNPAGAERELQLAVGSVDAERRAEVRIRIDMALGRHQQVLDALAGTDLPLAPARRAFYRGTALQVLRRPAEAREQFQSALAADANLVAAQIGVIESEAALGDRRGALDAIARLTTQHPESAAAWYSYGVQAAGSGGDMQTAKAALSKAKELAPRQLEIMKQIALLAQLAEVQLLERDLDGARASSKALDQLAAGTPFAMIIASRIAMAENNYGAAVTTLRRVVESAPGLTQARFLLSVALVAQGSLQQASVELNTVVDQAPSNIEARQLLAQVRMQLEDPDGALQVLVPALESDATNVRVNALADTARSKLGAEESIAMLEQMLAQEPASTGLQVQLASAYVQAGLPDKAATLLRKDQDSADTRRAALLLHSITATEGAAAARVEVDRLMAAHPTDPLLVSLAAAFYARSGDVETGRALLKRGLERGVEAPSLLFTLAQIEQGAGNATAAREALQRLLKAQPKHVAARMALAEIALAQRDSAGATRQLEIVRAEHPTSIEPRLQLARIALAGGDAKQAEALSAQILRMGAERADVRNAIGALYLSAGRYDQALDHFRVGTTVDSKNPLLWLNLGRTQLALGQKETARASVERALKERPQWLLAEGMLAFMDIQDGKREAAMARVAALEKSHPGDAAVRALQGELYAVTGRYAEAAATYEEAYAARPSASLAAKSYYARLAGRLAGPEKLLEKWVALRPADIGSRLLLAEALVRSEQRKEAVAQYEVILKAQPRDVPALNNLAWLYYELGDPRAVEYARQAAELAPQSVAVKDTLGWILLERGDLEGGLQLLKAAATAQPQTGVEIEYHYAVALARTGSTAEARQRLERLLRQDTAFAGREAAQQLLSRLNASGTVTPGAAAL